MVTLAELIGRIGKRQIIQLSLAFAIFLGLALWYPHSPMYHDLKIIYQIPTERQQAIHYLVINSWRIPFRDKQAIMNRYDIKPEELNVMPMLEPEKNSVTQNLSIGTRIIQNNSIVRWLLGYPPPKD